MPTAVSRQTQVASSTLLSTFALWRGTMLVFAAKQPKKRIRLYDLEGDLACRQVRERLTELELAYTLHNVGKEQLTDLGPASLRLRPGPYRPQPGGRRAELLQRWGRVQLPYLEDPNTGVAMFESGDIIDYLETTYAL